MIAMGAAKADVERDIELRKARFKSRLRRAAQAAGYRNLFDLGRECGMSKDSFKKYMSGTRFPNFDCILRLSMTLGVPADWLMGCDEGPLLRSVLNARSIDAAYMEANPFAIESKPEARHELPRQDDSIKETTYDSGSCGEAEREEELCESARWNVGQL